jgi:hypothetical protein
MLWRRRAEHVFRGTLTVGDEVVRMPGENTLLLRDNCGHVHLEEATGWDQPGFEQAPVQGVEPARRSPPHTHTRTHTHTHAIHTHTHTCNTHTAKTKTKSVVPHE